MQTEGVCRKKTLVKADPTTNLALEGEVKMLL
jgi:hypothetical protein